MTPLLMRRGTSADLDEVMSLLNTRISWLRQRGINDQWSTRDFFPIMSNALRAGDTWIMTKQDVPVATLTMSTIADPDFWAAEERAVPALYLSKLTTDPNVAGRGIGSLLIDWANSYAQSWGVTTLRWDVWRTNHGLQSYYEQIGKHIRTMNVPGRWSGALFEISFRAVPDLHNVVKTQLDQAVSLTVESQLIRLHARDYAENDNNPYSPELGRPDHVHKITGLDVPPLDTAKPLPSREPLIRSDDRQGMLLYNSGDGWRAKTFFSHDVTSWPNQYHLQPGRLYRLVHQQTGEHCMVTLLTETSTQ